MNMHAHMCVCVQLNSFEAYDDCWASRIHMFCMYFKIGILIFLKFVTQYISNFLLNYKVAKRTGVYQFVSGITEINNMDFRMCVCVWLCERYECACVFPRMCFLCVFVCICAYASVCFCVHIHICVSVLWVWLYVCVCVCLWACMLCVCMRGRELLVNSIVWKTLIVD